MKNGALHRGRKISSFVLLWGVLTACSAQAKKTSIDDLLDWTFGSRHKGMQDPPITVGSLPAVTGFQIVAVPGSIGTPEKSAFTARTSCLAIQSMLPIPDSRLLLSSGAKLWLTRAAQASPTMPELPIELQRPAKFPPPGMAVSRLLAVQQPTAPLRAGAEQSAGQPLAPNRDGTPLHILAILKDRNERMEVWDLPLRGSELVAPARVSDLPVDQAAYFAKYRVPHCKETDQECLVVQHTSETLIDIQNRSGNRDTRPGLALGPMVVKDAVWAVGEQRIYLLAQCQSNRAGEVP